ncbi:MAG TPA: hypothetical protein VNE63_11900 [Candidatus Acidoferrales bacterium]|nr:hypothetical protein [Candidatus Acidoferrales bacterium]
MTSIRLFLLALAFLSFAILTGAADHYVATSGSAQGNGSLEHPWDLQTALDQPASVKPGDTIWVRGGTYHTSTIAGFVNKLNGTASKPIIVRNYNGERASIDGHGTDFGLAIYGSYTWFWGLEVLDSTTLRISTGTARTNAVGVGVYGPGIKCINMVVHDTTQGFSGYNASPDSEYYGNLSYYNGFVGTDRNHGHGMYFQNNTGTKVVADNFVGDNADEGIQIYGSGNANLNGFRITGNTVYNNDSWPTPHYQYNVVIGGGRTRRDIEYMENYSYLPPAAASGLVMLGAYSPGEDIKIQDNVFVGGEQPVVVSEQAGPVSFTGNTVYGGKTALRLLSLILDTGESLSSYAWDNNTYYDLSSYHFYEGTLKNGSPSGINQPFADWQASTHFDAHSKYNATAPKGTWVYVRRNRYEAKRANITIYNWSLSAKVPVDLSSVLRAGDNFVIQDAQNFYGPPVARGTYTGTPVIVPMIGLVKATPVGFAAPAHTAPEFGTFVVLPAGPPRTSPRKSPQ